jgi:hypothetical protein
MDLARRSIATLRPLASTSQFYNLCRTHEALRMTPATALGITDPVWSVSELIEAALKAVPTKPTPTPAQRRRQFRVIQGDLLE